ncbi:hypothetical protein [Streptomyces sp. KL116D]|uniref:hypothetical protein n=1 Tax=Streptomyces sp. KL116D TaxID=3045152 RepID=UPI003556F4AE
MARRTDHASTGWSSPPARALPRRGARPGGRRRTDLPGTRPGRRAQRAGTGTSSTPRRSWSRWCAAGARTAHRRHRRGPRPRTRRTGGLARPVRRGTAPAADLPTYPFQRRRHWLTDGPGGGDVTSAGLDSARHPLLRAAGAARRLRRRPVHRPDLGPQPPWFADHAVAGTLLVPGTALVELSRFHVGTALGCERLRNSPSRHLVL